MTDMVGLPLQLLLDATSAEAILRTEVIQRVWGGNGEIVRVYLKGPADPTVVVKCILPQTQNDHPRGWNTEAGFQRKLESYRVELNWYLNYANKCSTICAVPRLLAHHTAGENSWLILQDLDLQYPERHGQLTVEQCLPCLQWLARFHAHYLHHQGDGLWPKGTYWHLDTRQEELNAMEDGELKNAASALDEILDGCRFKTLVHGDAKVANVCFDSRCENVAMVDFQYVGKGCGIKDVVYFLGSCLDEDECKRYDQYLLDSYFGALCTQLNSELADRIEREWRDLYAIAWTDVHRFLAGWMPGHRKINQYTRQLTNAALESVSAHTRDPSL